MTARGGRGPTGAPSRSRRPLLGWLALAGVALALTVPADRSAARDSGASDADLRRGGELYALYCVTCHGSDGRGLPGDGVAAGPPVDDVEVAYVDLLLRTGRMPIVEPRVGIIDQPSITGEDREALVAFMADAFDLTGSVPEVADGDAGRGQALYATYCAACHGSTGSGGVSGDGVLVRPVIGLDRVAIVEAIRVGPFEMPRFDPAVLDDRDAADLAAYVDTMSARPTTPLGVTEMNRVTMAVLAAVLAAAVLAGVFVLARPVRYPEPDDGFEAERP